MCLRSETGLARGVNRNAITIRMPWPDDALWQNVRVHWAARSAATRSARALAGWECKASGCKFITLTGPPLIRWSVHRPPKSRADYLNAIGACKPYLDGIQDAMMIDDGKFLHDLPRGFGERVPGGLIVVTITDGGNQ